MRVSVGLLGVGLIAARNIDDDIRELERGSTGLRHILTPRQHAGGVGHSTFSYSSSYSVSDGSGHTRSSSDRLHEASAWNGDKTDFEGDAITQRDGKVVGAGQEWERNDGHGDEEAVARALGRDGKVHEKRSGVKGDAGRFMSQVEDELR